MSLVQRSAGRRWPAGSALGSSRSHPRLDLDNCHQAHVLVADVVAPIFEVSEGACQRLARVEVSVEIMAPIHANHNLLPTLVVSKVWAQGGPGSDLVGHGSSLPVPNHGMEKTGPLELILFLDKLRLKGGRDNSSGLRLRLIQDLGRHLTQDGSQLCRFRRKPHSLLVGRGCHTHPALASLWVNHQFDSHLIPFMKVVRLTPSYFLHR